MPKTNKVLDLGFHAGGSFIRIAVNFAKHIRVGKECAETSFSAKQNFLPFVLGRREVLRVGIAEDTSAKGGESFGAGTFFAHCLNSAMKTSKGAMMSLSVERSTCERTPLVKRV